MRMREAEVHRGVYERPPPENLRKLLRFHLHDWIIFVILFILYGVLNLIEPFHRYINQFMVANLSYPFKSATVPFWSVPIYTIILPVLIFSMFMCAKRSSVGELHNAIHGLLFTLAITAVLTQILKVSTGRPRPDFMSRCFPGGFNKDWTFDLAGHGGVICSPNASKSDVKQGYQSFPSGHTSWSFAGLGYLSWYLAGKLHIYDRKGHTSKFAITLFPLLLATLVAISLVDDYWHHWTDVFIGGLLGLIVATVIYHLHFPPIFGSHSGIAYVFTRPSVMRALNEENPATNHATIDSPTDIEAGTNPRS